MGGSWPAVVIRVEVITLNSPTHRPRHCGKITCTGMNRGIPTSETAQRNSATKCKLQHHGGRGLALQLTSSDAAPTYSEG